MEYLYYSALFGLLYFYLGIGFALLASPLALRPYAWMLAPPVGYCYVLLAGWYCYRLELQGTDVYGPALLIPPGAMLLVAVFLRTTRKTTIAGTNLGDVLLPLGVAILGFTVLSIPSMSTPGLTAISEGHNNDIAQYSAVSRFLKEFARSDTLGFLGQAWEIKWLADDTVFGAFFSTALAASVIGRPTYQLQNIAMHVFFSYGCLLLYGLARRVFGHAMIGAASLTAVYALSPLTYYTMYQGFVSQIIAMSLMLALLLCYLSSVNDATTRTGEWRYLALAVLLTWGLSLTYPHMVPLIYGAVFVYTAVSGIARRDVRWFVRSTTFMLSTLFFTVLLSPGRAKALVDYFRFTGKVQAGWFVAFLWPDVVTGLTPLPDNVFLILGMNSIRALISVLVLAVAVIGIVAVYRADRDVAILAATLGGIIGCAYVLLAVLGRSPSGLGGFKGYKLLSLRQSRSAPGWANICGMSHCRLNRDAATVRSSYERTWRPASELHIPR